MVGNTITKLNDKVVPKLSVKPESNSLFFDFSSKPEQLGLPSSICLKVVQHVFMHLYLYFSMLNQDIEWYIKKIRVINKP